MVGPAVPEIRDRIVDLQVGERQRQGAADEAGPGQVGQGAHAHPIKLVDLLDGAHGRQLSDHPAPHLGRHDVAEHERDDLSQRAPAREPACDRSGAEAPGR